MSSTTRVDDTDPRFDYKDNAWTAGGQSGEFDSTSHTASAAGAMVTYPFTGTSVTVYSTVGTYQTKVHFSVDDGMVNNDLPAQSGSQVQFQQPVFTASGLDPDAQHKLAINLLDSGPFTLDFLLIGNGQSSASQQQSVIVSSRDITLAKTALTLDVSSSSNTLSSISASPSVGGTLISSSTSTKPRGSDISTTSVSSTISSASLSSSTVPVQAVGASPTSSSPNSGPPIVVVSAGSTVTLPASSSPTTAAMEANSSSSSDVVVIGSVTGAIAFFAIIVVSVVLYLRRRRSARPGRSVPNNKPSGWLNSQPKHRPSLHLSVPSPLSIPRSIQRPSLLPTHSSKSLLNSTKHSGSTGTLYPTPSFLAEDPNDSPIFDIKQRPVSGATFSTRVTVGTQRVSVPDSVYRYPYPETPVPVPLPVPPLPALPTTKSSNPSPTETGASSAGSVSHFVFGLPDTNRSGTLDTSLFSGYPENGNGMAGSGTSASRPLPYIPIDAKHAQADDHAATSDSRNDHSYSHHHLPSTPSEMETVIHQDAGVRLASSVNNQPRRELPPPYQDYEF